MTERPLDPVPDLPPDLSALEDELRSFRVEERPSFSPELRAELERRWRGGVARPGRLSPERHQGIAAVLCVLLVGALAVSPARASLTELSLQSWRLLTGKEEPAVRADRPLDPAPRSATPGADPGTAEPAGRRPRAMEHAPMPSKEGPAHGIGNDVPAPFRQPAVTFPELLDREADGEAIRRHYPEALQREGVGGTATLRLWVDSIGSVGDVQVVRGSGRSGLDRAAMRAARDLHWVPATRDLAPVGTWVEFHMIFDPRVTPLGPPEPPPVDEPMLVGELASELPPAWAGESVVPSAIGVEARELLRSALRWTPALAERLGSLESLLEGAPDRGFSPLTWRAEATAALRRAMAHDPDNPAPYLSLGRIRLKQGLHGEARALLEKGVDRARRSARPPSTELVAELYYELGLLLRNESLAWRDLGIVDDSRLDAGGCPGAQAPTGGEEGGAAKALVAWNYLCSEALERVFADGFHEIRAASDPALATTAAFESAVEASPAHRGANVALLLDLADRERWYELLNGARAFGQVSSGHPYALLMSGMALHRIGWPEQGMEHFERALRRLPEGEVSRLRDPSLLMTPDQVRRLERMDGGTAERAKADYWASVDPVLTTLVNEREVEHLARGAYATLRFGGLESDGARLWMRYGRPLRVRTLGAGSALRTEFWDYGRGPDVTFHRPATSPDPDLTPEARAYVEDLRAVVPQWYGTRARSVSDLPAQVARFRGMEPDEVEVQVHALVPETFGTGGSDSLHLTVVVQEEGGAVLSRNDLRIAALPRIVRIPTIRAPAGADRVVVELFHPGLSQVVGKRIPVRWAEEGEASRRVSDLLLTDPPTTGEAGPPSRGAPGLGVRTRGDDATGDRMGVLFEVYDLPPGVTYRLRMVLESPEAGSILLPLRPVGADAFHREWIRSAGGESRTTEHLTVDLSAVPAGSHVLRLEVRPEEGEPWLVTRRIDRY